MNTRFWYGHCLKIGIVLAATSGYLCSQRAIAQIVPDRTLGVESSVVTPVDIKGLPSDRIDAGAIRGANLFHSFQEFNIRDGRGAYFSNPAGIENIFSRVTGTNASNIFGKLGVLGNANLFLLNPNGIIFGPNAKLDIAGSFSASTGNSFNFGDAKFSATNPTDAPLLSVKVPLGVQFNQNQPSAIANSGNLSVGTGQNLNLMGGTVVSTGQLSAPGGQIAVASVPGGSVVNLSPSAQFLNVETSSPVASVGSTSLSELLTSVDERSRPGLTVNNNGQVELTGSGLPVVDGDVVARNVTAKTATLTANNNLTLVESQLGTTGDLNLLAGDTVRVRDSVTNPFVAQAGGKLLVQGRQGVDIFALNNSSSGLVSGGDLVLRSLNTVGGDAHYWAGGNFRIEKLDGSLGGLFSPYDPIIRASGDVSFQSYTGGSLHILAGGRVTIPGTVTITGADGTNGLAERVFLSDDDPNGIRSFVDIDGANFATLDIRSGTTAFGTVGLTPNPIPGIVPPNFSVDPTSVPTSANIQIGSIVNEQPGGQIFLTNQYQPNSIAEGSINITREILRDRNDPNSGSFSVITLGNPVTIDARSNVQTLGIITGVAAGAGGNIKILSVGDINILRGNNGFGAGLSSVVNGGRIDQNNRSGDITLISTNGDIRTQGQVTTFTSSGQGGNIIFRARNNIIIGNEIASRVLNENQNEQRGNSGNIQINSVTGNINLGAATPSILNQIASSTPNGRGGNIVLNAPQGQITTTGWTIRTESLNGVAGDVTITADGDIRSGNIEASSNSNDNAEGFSEITLNSSRGSVFLDRVRLNTTNTGSNFAGDINIIAERGNINILGNNPVRNPGSIPDIESNGYFGIITIRSGGNVSLRDTIVSAITSSSLPRPLGSSRQAGNINVTSTNGNIKITNSDLTARTESQFASPGNISLTANRGKVQIQENSLIRTNIEPNAGIVIPGNSPDGDNTNFGNIRISGNSVEIRGSEVTATSASQVPAGSVNVTASESFILSGTSFTDFRSPLSNPTPQTVQRRPGLFAEATRQDGTAGGVEIVTNKLRVENGAQVTVSSQQGQAGNVVVLAKEISLNNAAILATTGSRGDGANIFLLGQGTTPDELRNLRSLIAEDKLRGESLPGSSLDFLHLGNESLIAANARGSADGGNVAIKTQVLIALPPTGRNSNGSDISANANRGRGGVIAIRAQPLGIYGIEFREGTTGTSLNDITATSVLGPAGIVSLRLPDVDPRRGLLQLPEDLGDSSRFIQSSCPVGGQRARSRFVVTGRGGLPPNPGSVLNSDILLGESGAIATPPENNSPAPIVEAQGVEIGPKGEIILAANPSQLTSSYSPWQRFIRGCYGK